MFKQKQTNTRRPKDQRQPATVFSYYSSRSGAESSRARYEPPTAPHKGFGRLKHLPTALAMIVIIGSVLYSSLLDSNPRVMVSASASGQSLQRPTGVYQNYIQERLDESLWNKNKLTLDTRSVVSDLQKQFPEVSQAIVTVPILGHRPVVRIAVSSPAFVLATQHGAYYINDSGVPLVRVSEVQNQLRDLQTVTDETGLPITTGTQILPTKTVDFISTVIGQLKATDTAVDSITLPLSANELHVRITGQPYVVRFNTSGDARVQVGTFLAVKKRLEGSKEIPKEYIDVRVDERAYYK